METPNICDKYGYHALNQAGILAANLYKIYQVPISTYMADFENIQVSKKFQEYDDTTTTFSLLVTVGDNVLMITPNSYLHINSMNRFVKGYIRRAVMAVLEDTWVKRWTYGMIETMNATSLWMLSKF